MFDGFWESFVPAFAVSFAVCFGIVVLIRLCQWTIYLTGKKVTETVGDRNRNGEMTEQSNQTDEG